MSNHSLDFEIKLYYGSELFILTDISSYSEIEDFLNKTYPDADRKDISIISDDFSVGFKDLSDVEYLFDQLDDVDNFEAYNAFCYHHGVIIGSGEFEDKFYDVYDSEYDFSVNYISDCGDLPDYYEPFFDYEEWANSSTFLFLDVGNKVAVFNE